MTKQTESMNLAQDLRSLADRFSEGWHEGIKIDASDIMLLSDAAQALEHPASSKPPKSHILVPLDVLEAAEESLGSFCSDHGWGDKDMQNMDNLSAYIAQHKAAHGIKE